jgi:hypothetical protein
MNKLIAIAATCLAVVGCGPVTPSAEQQDEAETARIQSEARSQVGLPRINSFTEKRLATKLAELRDKPNLLTYTYLLGMDGRLRCLGKSVGFGIPYSTQITNPQKADGNSYGYYTLPQAEPNGLYMPESAAATWVMLVDAKGEARPAYVESDVTVTTVPLTGPIVAASC